MRSFLSYVLPAVMLITSYSAQAQQTLTFREPVPGPAADYITAVLEEAYADLGIALAYQPLPRLRAEQLAESGEIAGELGRLHGLDERFTSLNRVPFKLYEFSIVLVAKQAQCGLCTLKAVDNIAYMTGMRAAEEVLNDYGFSRTVFRQNNIEQIAKLLNADRIEAALVADFQLRSLNLSAPEDYVIYTVRSQFAYHYLHDKYQHLIEPLYQRLTSMQASGRLAQLRQRYQMQLPEQLKPIPMPTKLVAAAALMPGLTDTDGESPLWQTLRRAFANAITEFDILVSNWPRAINALQEDKAQMLAGVREHQFDTQLLYSEQPIAMDDSLYLFTANETIKQAIINGTEQLTICFSGSPEQRRFLPDNLSFYRANTSLDCFALLDLDRVEGVIDYKSNLPDWTASPYHRELLRKPVPLYVAFKNTELGARLKSHLDSALKAQLTPSFISENSNAVR